MPRALAGQPDYPQPVAIACPSNQSGDQVREVTYLIRGRYVDFTGTVRPYFRTMPDARANVFIIAGFKERDGTLTRQERGRQLTATMQAPAPLAASVEGAEQLTLQIACEEPDGVVVIVDAALTPA
jgi:hypothetical protein